MISRPTFISLLAGGAAAVLTGCGAGTQTVPASYSFPASTVVNGSFTEIDATTKAYHGVITLRLPDGMAVSGTAAKVISKDGKLVVYASKSGLVGTFGRHGDRPVESRIVIEH
jgi:hypothetical protein